MSTLPIEALASLQAPIVQPSPMQSVAVAAQSRPAGAASFASLMANGVEQVNQKLLAADAAVSAFAVDDTIPLHQVTFALEEARLSFELMMQVRNRLVEGYQEILRMQI